MEKGKGRNKKGRNIRKTLNKMTTVKTKKTASHHPHYFITTSYYYCTDLHFFFTEFEPQCLTHIVQLCYTSHLECAVSVSAVGGEEGVGVGVVVRNEERGGEERIGEVVRKELER